MNLEEIITEVKNDPRNAQYTQRGIPPILQVNKEAKILIIGQAPGRKVEESLIPFNDQSGITLMEWLGIDRETFYSKQIGILPMDFYYPGKGKTGDLPPRPFMAEYHAQIRRLMSNVQMVVLVGSYAIKHYLGKKAKKNLTETVRSYEDYLPDYFPIVHPSPLNFRWQKMNPWFKEDVVPVLQEHVHRILKDQELHNEQVKKRKLKKDYQTYTIVFCFQYI